MLSVSVITFEIYDVQFWWPWTRTVQGHPMSKVMVSIKSPFMVSYLTFIVSNIVSLMVFEISDVEVLWLRSRTVQGHLRCQSIAHGWLPIRLLLTPTPYLSPFLKYLTSNFDDCKLGQFKVIQSQRSWCQSIAQSRFHIWLPLTPSWYLSLFSRHLTLKLFFP